MYGLGEKYRDIISGIEGVAVVRATHVNGCVFYRLVCGVNEKTGKPVENIFDEIRLEPVPAT